MNDSQDPQSNQPSEYPPHANFGPDSRRVPGDLRALGMNWPPYVPQPVGDARFRVYGLHLVVQMGDESLAPYPLQCPQGHPIQYGKVVSCGDGFDPQAGAFRSMPPLASIVVFEEPAEGIEGHYLFVGDDEYRVLYLDVITMTFPPPAGAQSE